jgi:hypothetical protein
MERDGFMRKDLQLKVKKSYEQLISEILQTIEDDYIRENKKGILVPLSES